jgi:hypothetical protein
MNKKLYAVFSLVIILAFIAYIVIDTVSSGTGNDEKKLLPLSSASDMWKVFGEYNVSDGPLTSVAVDKTGNIYLGGDSYVISLDKNLSKKWALKTEVKITALTVYNDTLYASTLENIYLISNSGRLLDEWGPYEAGSIITSISVNKNFIAFADAGVKRVFLLKKNGEVSAMMGQADEKFIIPSPYFDVVVNEDDTVYIANTGKRRVEKWTKDGKLISFFGVPGTAPGAFAGCCNPAHFAIADQHFITAEKGINRIKMLDKKGGFIEFISSENKFMASIPLDIALSDGETIYAANPSDSKLYLFKRK